MKKNISLEWIESGYGNRFQRFQNLMTKRIRDVLLVSSPYDLFVFEEDGRLYELIRKEYQLLNLTHAPEITRVDSGKEAISLALGEKSFDLIITTLHITDMHPWELSDALKNEGVNTPVVLLSFDSRELKDLIRKEDESGFEKTFIWNGDFKLIMAMVKCLEDKYNVENDTKLVGVQSIILIEDNVSYYSSFLPLIYSELLKQSQRLISEGINITHNYLRMRARPKILLCSDYEEAWSYFEKYHKTILGVISDVEFSREGKKDNFAGIKFAQNVKQRYPDIPVLLQSNNPDLKQASLETGNSFLYKQSPAMLEELRQYMMDYFGFGDFVFRTPDGMEAGRASNLKELEEQLEVVPEESIIHHGKRNHFSNWFKARTEFDLAHQLRPRKVTDFASVGSLRQMLIKSIKDYLINRQRGFITDFVKETFDPYSSFARIGGGSLGGKARGLGFINTIINNYNIRDRFEGIIISVPASIVIATDIFDQFLEENELKNFALNCANDDEITKRFLDSKIFPKEAEKKLSEFLEIMTEPLAVRSSSLLEDSQYQPFAGVYQTYMIPNNNPDAAKRLKELIDAVKRVYASTFYQGAKNYINVTTYRLEEEKMGVIIQNITGSKKENRFYPDFSGVGKSYNFYPSYPQTPADGIISVALGLGKMIAEGGSSVRFSPKYPNHIPQFSTVDYTLKNNQYEFYALDVAAKVEHKYMTHDELVKRYNLSIAEEDGALYSVGSTYSRDEHTIYDGLSRKGTRLVTFSPVLKNKIFPLPEITTLLLEMGSWGLGSPVEMEFAVDITVPHGEPKKFSVLQLRPLVLKREIDELDVEVSDRSELICASAKVLGNGSIEEIFDIVFVDADKFDRSKSREIAKEVSYYNTKLISEGKPYLLIGVGRWGTLDPWLGIPVTWDQICGARAIIETSFKDFDLTLSQGSHFFQNLTSLMVGYFTIDINNENEFIDWDWLRSVPPVESSEFTKHISFVKPLVVKMNGHQNKGIIYKP